MHIGILCRSKDKFINTIDYMIRFNMINEARIKVKNRNVVKLDNDITFSPISLNSLDDSRGHRFDLIIPEMQMPYIAESQNFQGKSYAYARLK